MTARVIEARDLGRTFAGVTALDGVTLEVRAGESVAVFGPNGAGKTTLLRLLATLLRPSHGTLRLFDQSVGDGAEARRRIGFLSHQSFLYPDLTPLENLEFYAEMYRTDAQRAHQLLDDVGLTGWAHRPVRTLSRGLEQRAALARAVLHDPDLLLLDEPFTGLDTAAASTLMRMLREAQARGTTLLMTTHDMTRGFDLCERAVILTNGRLVWSGVLAETSPDALVHLYEARTQRGSPTVGASAARL